MIAQISAPSLSADALERINQIDTRATIHARITPAIVDVLVAVHPGVTRITDAPSPTASASTTAWSTLATATGLLVHDTKLWIVRGRFRTILSLPLFRTVTIVVGLRVETGGRVSARVRAAMIPIDLALIASETNRTNALVRVYEVSAFPTVLTGFRGTLVNVHVAVLAGVASCTAAVIIVNKVDA